MLSIAIQAGGRSERMGRGKARVLLAGQPLITHVLGRVAHLGTEILVTTNAPEDYAFLGVRLAGDEQPGAGALAGLRTALRAARHETVSSCVRPAVRVLPLLEHASDSHPADAVVPRWRRVRAAACRLSAARLPAIERSRRGPAADDQLPCPPSTDRGRRRPGRDHDPDGLTFFNVNTPDDLQAAERILAGGGRSAQPPPEDR
jgi:molybdopterin-guanine dinucleotide biosynthesis protein A